MRGDAQQAVTSYTDALKDRRIPNDRRAAILNDRGVAYIKLGLGPPGDRGLQSRRAALSRVRRRLQQSRQPAAVARPAEGGAQGFRPRHRARAGLCRGLQQSRRRLRASSARSRTRSATTPRPSQLRAVQSRAAERPRPRASRAPQRPHAAIRDFTRAVNADARFAAGYRNRAEAKLEVEHFDEADRGPVARHRLRRQQRRELCAARAGLPGDEEHRLRDQGFHAGDRARSQELASAYAARGLAHGSPRPTRRPSPISTRPSSSTRARASRSPIAPMSISRTDRSTSAQRDIEVAEKLEPRSRRGLLGAAPRSTRRRARPSWPSPISRRPSALRPGYREAADSLQRLGQRPVGRGDATFPAPASTPGASSRAARATSPSTISIRAFPCRSR